MDTVVKSLNESLRRLLETRPEVIVFGEDLVDPYGGAFKVTKGLSTRFPDRVLSTPISESSLAGMAAGLSIRGMRPILEIMFGDFLTLCADQLINHIAKYRWMYNNQVALPLVIRTPMGGRRGYGPTHSQTIEKLYCGIPGLRVVAVNRLVNPGALLASAMDAAEPTLFIENKSLYPQLLFSTEPGAVYGGSVRFSAKIFPTATVSWTGFESADATLVCYGAMSEVLLQSARELLMEEEIACEVVVLSHVKPFDPVPVLDSARRTHRVAIFEEGTEGWGWGREVAYRVMERMPEIAASCRSYGAREVPIGNSKALEDKALPQISDVKNAVRLLLEPRTAAPERFHAPR